MNKTPYSKIFITSITERPFANCTSHTPLILAGGSNVDYTRSQPNTNNFIGTTIVYTGRQFNSQLYYLYIVPIAISDTDRLILEAT